MVKLILIVFPGTTEIQAHPAPFPTNQTSHRNPAESVCMQTDATVTVKFPEFRYKTNTVS